MLKEGIGPGLRVRTAIAIEGIIRDVIRTAGLGPVLKVEHDGCGRRRGKPGGRPQIGGAGWCRYEGGGSRPATTRQEDGKCGIKDGHHGNSQRLVHRHPELMNLRTMMPRSRRRVNQNHRGSACNSRKGWIPSSAPTSTVPRRQRLWIGG